MAASTIKSHPNYEELLFPFSSTLNKIKVTIIKLGRVLSFNAYESISIRQRSRIGEQKIMCIASNGDPKCEPAVGNAGQWHFSTAESCAPDSRLVLFLLISAKGSTIT